MLGALVGFALRGTPAGDVTPALASHNLPRLAAVAHAVYTPEVRHSVEVGADREAQLVGWLSKRLGAELKPPGWKPQATSASVAAGCPATRTKSPNSCTRTPRRTA